MVRIIECAASGVLLVIPDDSHVWRRMAEAREQALKACQENETQASTRRAPATTSGRPLAAS